jgi:phospholipid/cholesterol/gamma-HCH transport system ATP-binding protein
VPSGVYWRTVWEQIASGGFTLRFIPNDFIQGLAKPFVFGGIISITACYFGINTTGGTEGWAEHDAHRRALEHPDPRRRLLPHADLLSVLAHDRRRRDAAGSPHRRAASSRGPDRPASRVAAERRRRVAARASAADDDPARHPRGARRRADRRVLLGDAPAGASGTPSSSSITCTSASTARSSRTCRSKPGKGETICLVGESGTGKSTTLKLILRLLVPDRGMVCIHGEDITNLTFEEALDARQHMGMVFQSAALFDSMSVFENVAYPLREHTQMDDDEIEERVREKLAFVDLDPDQVMSQLPVAALRRACGKRVGIARGHGQQPGDHALRRARRPASIRSAPGTITRLIMKLQRELDVTSVVVSHDIRSVFRMATRVAVLNERRIVFFGTPEEMAASDDKYLRDFLGGS